MDANKIYEADLEIMQRLDMKDFAAMNFYIEEFSHGSRLTHNHSFFEIGYVKKGGAVHILDGVKMNLKKGSYFIVDYKKFHSFHSITENDNIELINCLFTADFIDKSLKNCKSFSEIVKCYLLKYDYSLLMNEPTKTVFYDDDGVILDMLSEMMKEYREKPVAHMELIRLHLLEIIIKTMRKITNPSVTSNTDSIKYVIDYIEENYNSDLYLSEIAKMKNYSLSHTSRKFKETTGMNFSEYLQRTRIRESCRLLINTNKKVIEISYLCGYRDVNNFNKLFKRFTGTTPVSFRKIHS